MTTAKPPTRKRSVLTLIGGVLILVGICGAGIAWLYGKDPRLVYTITTTEGLYHVAFSPDGQMLATSASNGEIALRRVADGSVERVLTGHTEPALLAFSPDGRQLVAASFGGTIRLWQLETGKQFVESQRDTFSSVAFSPDNKLLASVSAWDRTLRVWRLAD